MEPQSALPDSLAMPMPMACAAGPWAEFIRHLGPQAEADLSARMAQLQRQVHDNGVSYNVYADADRPQRPWALDVFPLLVDAPSWRQIEAGVQQRMRLLEHILADVYGPQTLLRSGMLPTALVQGHPGYLHAMQGVAPVGGRHLSLAAFDLARGPEGAWWLLSQRTQAPSGLGYLLENRALVSRQFPDAFAAMGVQQVAKAYQSLLRGISERAPGGSDAHIALLTPGPYNETYFEHAYLARYLGLSLVQGSDLLVRDEKLYLKTLQGLQRVHALLKRVDDDWLDPLELRADSTLGVPGLLQAVRRGNVLLANAPGSGFLESSALLGFMPALAPQVLGEQLQLPAVPGWWCGETSAMHAALPRMQECVIKPSYPPHAGRSSFEPVIGRTLSQRERDEWAGRILRDGAAYTLQAFLPLSHTPVWQTDGAGGSMGTRPVILRVFALADEMGGWTVLPGGLARLGTPEGIASMQRGGSSADVWVLPAAPSAAEVAMPPSNPQANLRTRIVTSRAAENLFWMGRYTERTENTVRLSRVALDALGGEDQTCQPLLAWLSALASQHGLVAPGVPPAQQARRVFERSLVAGVWDTRHCTGVAFNVQALVLAASRVRERMSPEHWGLVMQAQHNLNPPQADTLHDPVQAQRVLVHTSGLLAALTGAQTDRMTRDDGWRLLSIGRHIERLDFLAGALAQALHTGSLSTQAGFDAVLALFDSTISFHAQYQQSRTMDALLELVLSNPDNPRSLAWVLHTLRSRLRRMGDLAQGRTAALAERLPELPAQAPWSGAQDTLQLGTTLHECRMAARATSDALNSLFFAHSGDASQSVGA